MAKFKVGDRVRSIFPSTHGSLMTLIAQKRNRTDLWIVEKDGGGDGHSSEITVEHNGRLYKSYAEKYLELIQEHTPITPKVGERYRVVKDILPGVLSDPRNTAKGDTLTIRRYGTTPDGTTWAIEQNSYWHAEKYLTTEYLELVEKPKFERWSETCAKYGGIILDTGQHVKIAPVDIYDHRANMERMREYWYSYYEQSIKKSLITKTMNFIKQSLLSKEDKTLIKAGYLNEDLSLTGTGKAALEFITFTANKAALVKMAAETIKEEKE